MRLLQGIYEEGCALEKRQITPLWPEEKCIPFYVPPLKKKTKKEEKEEEGEEGEPLPFFSSFFPSPSPPPFGQEPSGPPTLTAFVPPSGGGREGGREELWSGVSVLVIPGGGYEHVALEEEGWPFAQVKFERKEGGREGGRQRKRHQDSSLTMSYLYIDSGCVSTGWQPPTSSPTGQPQAGKSLPSLPPSSPRFFLPSLPPSSLFISHLPSLPFLPVH